MTRSIHVRLDDVSAEALDVVRASGLNDSDAVRTALREAAERRRGRTALRQEVEMLMASDVDRSEMAAVRDLMADLAPLEQQ